MEDLKMSPSNADNFNINILVDSERGKEILKEFLDNSDNTDNEEQHEINND
jgi:acetolactate synthase regulatory subunit